MKVSVIIPQYKHYELLHQILYDLYAFCRQSIDEIVIVEDCSKDDDLTMYLEMGMGMKFFPTELVTNTENLGFLKSCNQGVKASSGEIIVLLSNDVRVRDNIIQQVKDCIQDEDTRVLFGNRLIDFDSGWNQFNGKIYKYLEGWFLACTKKIWTELGGFDEQFSPNDYEDVDLSTTALSKRILLHSFENKKVWHLGAQSLGYNPNREALTKRNKELFRKKWIK